MRTKKMLFMNSGLIKHIWLIGLLLGISVKGNSADKWGWGIPSYIRQTNANGDFKIAGDGVSATICVDPSDWKGVIRAAHDLKEDVRRVSGLTAEVTETTSLPSSSVLVGTIGKSKLIDRLIADKKIDVSEIQGQWESFLIQTVDGHLVIVGSDRRGTIYGIYDVSEKIGVSPWYWWADVPVKKKKSLYVKAGRYVQPSPKVKYRGIFINDEEPSFGQWTRKKFGGFNSKMYSHLFELLLRLKANYFWPAMWSSAFNEDDPLNPVIADEYGIVMGTSHHEPMMRAHQEYARRRKEIGPWDYVTNKERIDSFFQEGIERNKAYDNLITIGMRGDGDAAMSNGSDEENMETLHAVIQGQREIIQNVYGKDASEVPQLWAIFTEVQRYYDKGFSVPDDVLLLFCDNNWGYIRRIGQKKEKEKNRKMGLYYHIDMNGGPCSDRWINTITIPKLREQFNLAYQTGLDDLWVVNVGDLKPKELPIDFIMRYAWNPDAIPADKVWDYTVRWAAGIFGEEHAEEIADIVSKYTKYNLWRKPEVQTTSIFSIVNHREADCVIHLWREVAARAEALQPKIAPEAQDAYYQLVLYPAKASAGVAEVYLQASKNNLYARQGRVSANDCADRAHELFETDKRLSNYYNDSLAGGKWKNMMQDVHFGYVSWQMPKENILPELKEVIPLETPEMGVAVEGSLNSWPSKESTTAELPVFDVLNKQSYYIDIFNRGTGAFQFKMKSNQSWVRLSEKQGKVEKEKRIMVSMDWNRMPLGETEAMIEIGHKQMTVPVKIKAVKTVLPETKDAYFGSLTGGEFSIPADKYNRNVAGKDAQWIVLPDLGRGEACMGIHPVTASSAESPDEAPRLEYKVFVPKAGKMTVCLGILPTQDVYPERGLRMAVGMDNNAPDKIDARKGFWDEFREYTKENLAKTKVLKPLPPRNRTIKLIGDGQPRRTEVFDNLRWVDVEMDVKEPGMHTLKVYMIDPEIVLEKIVVNPDNNYPSYFGAPVMHHNTEYKPIYHGVGNPYLPLWEHLPDGEPRVFEDPDKPGKYRVYIIGSHDVRFSGYCGADIRMWSASVEDLSSWRDEGPIFTYQAKGQWDVMYAPDLVEVKRKDGTKEYYLYPHSRGKNREAMVAKSNRPDGPFVPVNLTKDGLKTLPGSVMGFDPSVYIENITAPNDPDYETGFRVYGYWGFQRSSAAQLDQKTMYSVRSGTKLIPYFMPSGSRDGSILDPEGISYPHIYSGEDPLAFNFYEASSIRKVGNKYVMIYSGYSGLEYGLENSNSTLRYAYGDSPLGPWKSGGVLVDSRAPVLSKDGSKLQTSNGGHNTHGSIEVING